MLLTSSLCHKLSHLLGPHPPSSVTYFMDGPRLIWTDQSEYAISKSGPHYMGDRLFCDTRHPNHLIDLLATALNGLLYFCASAASRWCCVAETSVIEVPIIIRILKRVRRK